MLLDEIIEDKFFVLVVEKEGDVEDTVDDEKEDDNFDAVIVDLLV